VLLTTLAPEESDRVKAFPLFFARATWTRGHLDPVLRAVADDVLESPLLIGAEQGCVIAPYDGGMDIFVSDQSQRDALLASYAQWLSPHSLGL
jgi:hypothetical protein